MGKWLQSSEHLVFEVRERVARITLNRPDRRNALSWELLSELRAALLEADDLRSVSVIVLGCTELPILLPGGEYVARNGSRATLVDPTEVLARKCVAHAMAGG